MVWFLDFWVRFILGWGGGRKKHSFCYQTKSCREKFVMVLRAQWFKANDLGLRGSRPRSGTNEPPQRATPFAGRAEIACGAPVHSYSCLVFGLDAGTSATIACPPSSNEQDMGAGRTSSCWLLPKQPDFMIHCVVNLEIQNRSWHDQHV